MPRLDFVPSSARSWLPRWPRRRYPQAADRGLRRANRPAPPKLPATFSGLVLQPGLRDAFGGVPVLSGCAVLPIADEVFLREYRYRNVVLGFPERKYA